MFCLQTAHERPSTIHEQLFSASKIKRSQYFTYISTPSYSEMKAIRTIPYSLPLHEGQCQHWRCKKWAAVRRYLTSDVLQHFNIFFAHTAPGFHKICEFDLIEFDFKLWLEFWSILCSDYFNARENVQCHALKKNTSGDMPIFSKLSYTRDLVAVSATYVPVRGQNDHTS